MTTFTCDCGARRHSIEITTPVDELPVYVPGPLTEPCTCPKCITCGYTLDHDSRCANLDCPLLGVHIVLPD